jgi:His-Xaa-Ser system radical SAM maturase HxsB
MVSDTGRFVLASDSFMERAVATGISEADSEVLGTLGHAIDPNDDFSVYSHAYGLAERLDSANALDYLIVVPTLRCNLNCSYCQVSRAGLNQQGFDWNDETLAAVFSIIDELETDSIKIEFQGGEPTLRPDLIRAVMDRCERFSFKQFVICTNLQQISDDVLAIFDRDDVYISTSLDGTISAHEANRTGPDTSIFIENLRFLVSRYGSGKISALPTLDPRHPPEIDAIIETFAAFGLSSIFLRPINFQGFARKRHKESQEQDQAWRKYYERFVRRIIERNWQDQSQCLEETYFSICLRRVFQPGADRHVDLRNPNPIGVDYVVIDYDGTVFPTDEARMLARSGIIDLSIGDVTNGWNTEKRQILNEASTNQFDPSCSVCAYQPYCGRDLVDDLARYGRVDRERTSTEFCRRHMHIYDFIFDLTYSDDPAVRYSLAKWLRLPAVPGALGPRVS